jgi:hypothetical protein
MDTADFQWMRDRFDNLERAVEAVADRLDFLTTLAARALPGARVCCGGTGAASDGRTTSSAGTVMSVTGPHAHVALDDKRLVTRRVTNLELAVG